MHPDTDRYARLRQALETIERLSRRADPDAINRLLAQPAKTAQVDTATIESLRHTSDTILAIQRALTALLAAAAVTEERSTLDFPTTRQSADAPAEEGRLIIDSAEAWRRVHLRLPDHRGASILLHIQEFQDGYQALPILVDIPEPPSIPAIDSPTTFVIDKITGTVSRWPLLRLDVLARQYRRYSQGAPVTFDAPACLAGPPQE